MKYYLSFIWILLFTHFANGQNEKLINSHDIDKRIEEANLKMNQGDMNSAMEELNAAILDAKAINHRDGVLSGGKTLMKLFFQKGDFNEVIRIQESINKDIKSSDNYTDLATVEQLNGLAYMGLGFFDLAEKEFAKAIQSADKDKGRDESHYVKSLIYSSHAALHESKNKEWDSVLVYLEKSLVELREISDDSKLADVRDAQLAFQSLNLGETYLEKNNPAKAEESYLKALSYYEDQKEGNIRDEIIIYSQLGKFYMHQNQFEKALDFLHRGLELEKKAKLPDMRRMMYSYLSNLYLAMDDAELSKEYRDRQVYLEDSISRANRSAVNENLGKIVDKSDAQHLKSRKRLSYTYLSLLAGLFMLAFISWRYREKQLHQRYLDIIDGLKKENDSYQIEAENIETDWEDIQPVVLETADVEKESAESIVESEDLAETADTNKANLGITDETLQHLLKKLNRFEKSNRFLKSDVTFPFLVNYLDSNSKYLSYILKYEKNKSFNQYINDLRVEYLIKLLYNEPKYREYKIEYLAGEIGFNSRSAFINSFKKKTGIAPSYFIKKLQLEFPKTK